MFGNASYPTFQVFLAILMAMALTIALLPLWIKILRHKQIGQQVRADGPQGHLVKQGTPTMGGVIILLVVSVTVLALGKFTPSLVLVLLATLLTGLLGLFDDVSKVVKERSLGLKPRAKLIVQAIISAAFCLFAV
ncbi:MAG: phospho-N-acetylmuramoyl-pentapeptide-transferase, partial [Actinobacteria bacterium]|nr:phospho-N-acetylmuramoyl-pentapeptide-transferase [Actinomycetota bacterium]